LGTAGSRIGTGMSTPVGMGSHSMSHGAMSGGHR
jgi:hypothetical protein